MNYEAELLAAQRQAAWLIACDILKEQGWSMALEISRAIPHAVAQLGGRMEIDRVMRLSGAKTGLKPWKDAKP